MTSTRARACAGKQAHESRAAAVAQLARLVRAGASAVMLAVYRCRHCGHYHVGHKGRVSGNRRKS